MTKNLETKIKELEATINSMKADNSLMYTNCLLIAKKNHYNEIIEYLNPTAQELIDLQEIEIDLIPDEKPKPISKISKKQATLF